MSKAMLNIDADLYAHRGANRDLPENTMYAIEHMVERGVKGIEIDVRLTKDGEVMLSHDTNVKRVSGEDKEIHEITSDEFKEINVGHYIFGEGKKVYPPMLSEVLKYCKENQVCCAIELKNKTHMSIVDKVFDVVAKESAEEYTRIYSFEEDILEAYAKKNPSYPLHLNMNNVSEKYIAMAKEKGWWLNPGIACITKEFVQESKEHGVDMHVWTVNDLKMMKTLACWGITVIITDELFRKNNQTKGVHESLTEDNLDDIP